MLNTKMISFSLTFLSVALSSFGSIDASGYPGCGSNVTSCFGSEIGCLDSGNCNVMMSYKFDKNNKVLNVMVQGKVSNINEYIAMALSTDNRMGNDLVRFFCKCSTLTTCSVLQRFWQDACNKSGQN